MDTDEECERLTSLITTLQSARVPSANMIATIEFFEQKLFHAQRVSWKYFKPYRNSNGQVVVHPVGDTEGDE